jgi:CheY-like chemotaxis protein
MSPQVNILLVDDHPENLLALEAILGNLGATLVRANSGQEALRCLLNQDFAVILLDVQMPGMDGFETATLIRSRERSRETPIIFQTAFSTSEQLMFKGYALGAVDYLLKPIDARYFDL